MGQTTNNGTYMKPIYEKPPYQPKWILRLQVWMLRCRVVPAFNKQSMVINTTGRKTGRPQSVPIDFVRDGTAIVALNMGGKSNWYRNALANPRVTLEIDGSVLPACAEPLPVDTPERL